MPRRRLRLWTQVYGAIILAVYAIVAKFPDVRKADAMKKKSKVVETGIGIYGHTSTTPLYTFIKVSVALCVVAMVLWLKCH